MLPRATNDPGALLPGAVLMGATLAAMQAISQLYLPDRFGRASEMYGAIGTTVVTLGWFFFIGRAFVARLALDAVIHERFGSISRFVFALPLLRLIPRHSTLVRRIFDLDVNVGLGSQPSCSPHCRARRRRFAAALAHLTDPR